MLFSDFKLSKFILRALAEAGLETPTPIQERAFPVIMSGRDVVGIAQTGTGKTIAYLLPALQLWEFQQHRFPQTLIVVPTRELAEQVLGVIEQLTPYLNVESAAVYGGVNMRRHQDRVDEGLDILVGTPGRLLDLVLQGSLRLKAVKRFVLDEVDELLELGFRPQLIRLMDHLPAKRQNLLFSATMVPEVEAIIEDTFDFPQYIEAAPVGTPLQQISQQAYRVPNFMTKLNLLAHLLEDEQTYHRVLAFAPSKRLADLAYDNLSERFPDAVGVIHGNKSQNFRFESLRRFETGEDRLLIATDLIARGLDLSDVSHVINIDTPAEPENYLHRIGRTGRADKTGTAITFVTEAELPQLRAAEELMQQSVPIEDLPAEVPVSEKQIPEEIPGAYVPNVTVKLKTGKGGAFHAKKSRNAKTKMTRQQLRESRQQPKHGQKKRRKKRKRK
jgi:ATP-dependent RNA helicase RhlE